MVLASVTLAVLVLFYVGTYRRGGSRYAAWWCLALLSAGVGTAAYLFNGTSLQGLMNPIGNLLSVAGVGFVWFAARAVRGEKPVWWLWGVVVGVTALASALDSPSEDVWAGGPVVLGGMSLSLGLAAWEISLVLRERKTLGPRGHEDGAKVSLLAMEVASTGLALFYVARLVGYLTIGPDDPRFEAWMGTSITTIALTVVLVVATFSMSEVSHLELNRDLRIRAAYDDLTGLLTRGEFLATAQKHSQGGATPRYAVMADLDYFKDLNDALGHAAGDRALRAFGAACRKAVEGHGIAGRVGGEEFALLVEARDLEDVRGIASEISRTYADAAPIRLGTPTVSYGVSEVQRGESMEQALARADEALYRAKRAGRDRFEVAETPAA